MKRFILVYLVCATLAESAFARIWTSTNGQEVEATVIKVNSDKTVVLKTKQGKTVTVPFSTFGYEDVEHLEYLLSRKGRGRLHPVPWEELNALFGISIWEDDNLWDDSTEDVSWRLRLEPESKTDFMENYRAYPLGNRVVLNNKIYTSVLYGADEKVSSLFFVFLNIGDEPKIVKTPGSIEKCGADIQEIISSKLGDPRRDELGKGDMREKVWRWDWNGHAVMLSLQERKYVAMRIMPINRADRAGRVEKLKGNELKERMAACVEKRNNGDIIIRNVPMIDQGPKGYCSPATWERYLRYMGIPADMYLLALAGRTGAGGGTYARSMINAVDPLLSSNGRELETIGRPNMENISEHIDQGLPIMWRFANTPSFQLTVNNNTARRNGEEEEEKLKTDKRERASGHICLIIGYNKTTNEVAISDSWGPKYAERWVPIYNLIRVTSGSMNVIKW